jgi:hypothetical protein
VLLHPLFSTVRYFQRSEDATLSRYGFGSASSIAFSTTLLWGLVLTRNEGMRGLSTSNCLYSGLFNGCVCHFTSLRAILRVCMRHCVAGLVFCYFNGATMYAFLMSCLLLFRA